MSVLLVDEVNPYAGASGRDHALYPSPHGSAGHRLCHTILGLEVRYYLRHYHRVNLCRGRWDLAAARQHAERLRDDLHDFAWDGAILCGAKVSLAFGLKFEPFSVVQELRLAETYGRDSTVAFAVLPHPSGLSRLWNEPGSYRRARALLRDAGMMRGAV